MKSKQKIFIVSILVIILVVIGLGFVINKSSGPGKYDAFAQALKSEGATFYGAFWCPHCQAQKAEFGSSKQFLPYVECSKPDGQTQTQACIDNKVESYPTWKFKNGINVTSKDAPVVCEIASSAPSKSEMCTANMRSQNGQVWIFPGYKFSIESPKDPIHTGDNWSFPAEAATRGEIPMEFLAQQINFKLDK